MLTGEMFTEEQNELIESAAEMLYGMIHARYILTSKGLASMVKKLFYILPVRIYTKCCFGSLPITNDFYSWTNTKTMTLEGARECIVVGSLVYRLGNLISLEQAR